MRLPGRLSAAMAVLEDIETRHRPAAEALKAWGLANRFAGASDRAAIGNLVYDALRKKASLGFAMGSESPRALVLAVAVRDWGHEPEALNALFEGDAHAPAPITPEEMERLTAGAHLSEQVREIPDILPPEIRADVPAWLAPSLDRNFGAAWIAEAAAMTERPPLDIRVNTLKATREKVARALGRFHPREDGPAPDGLRLPAGGEDARTPNVQSDEGYLKGWFEVQDQGSQMVAILAGARPGEQVLDLCAGAGGKTLAMAAAMGNKGQIFAYDSERSRLAPIYDRLKRAGVRNAQVRPPDAGALDDLAGKLDRVVVDAPCTGTGTWRRRPDTKWKLTPEQLAQRVGEQKAILEQASGFVKPGGQLAYITCSILAEENGDQVRSFLAAHPDFEAVPANKLWHSHFSGSTARARFSEEGGIALSPLGTGTDGFYIAVMTRKKS